MYVLHALTGPPTMSTCVIENVRTHFGKFGTVTEVLMKFTEFNESRGFCFVEFDSEDTAEASCNAKGQVIDDKEVWHLANS